MPAYEIISLVEATPKLRAPGTGDTYLAPRALAITAETATTNITAFSVTRTNNDASVVKGVEFTFTDTSSAAGFLPFAVNGGAAGTTKLADLTKAGTLRAVSLQSNNDEGGLVLLANTTFGTGNALGALDITGGATGRLRLNSVGNIGFSNSATGVATLDSNISRISAGVIGVGTGAAGSFAGDIKYTSAIAGTANGATWTHGQASELLTLSTSGTTTDTSADLLPANSIIEAVVARVTTTITTATDWKLGDPTTAGRFTAANATMTAGTTDVGLVHVDQTGAAGPRQTAAAKVRVTTTGTPGAGAIRITTFYRTLVAPTS